MTYINLKHIDIILQRQIVVNEVAKQGTKKLKEN